MPGHGCIIISLNDQGSYAIFCGSWFSFEGINFEDITNGFSFNYDVRPPDRTEKTEDGFVLAQDIQHKKFLRVTSTDIVFGLEGEWQYKDIDLSSNPDWNGYAWYTRISPALNSGNTAYFKSIYFL